MRENYLNYKDNPNPTANIGFMCYVPLNFYVYENIYKHLPNSEFIVGDSYDVEGYSLISDYLENLLEFFSKQNAYWRFANPQDKKLTKNEFYSKYAVLVSTWYRGATAAPYNKDKKLVRVMYGHAKDPWNFGPWSAYFDLILSYGEYSQKFLSFYGTSTIVGNPKFDDWFSDNIDAGELNKIKRALNPVKKTILYVPTHGYLSSLGIMINAINSLSSDYNIILKVHHNTHLYEQETLTPYKENPRIIIKGDEDDILPLLKVADFVVSDNSGAIFDATLADKPIILVDFLDDNFFEEFKENLFYLFEGRHMGVVTGKNSIEQIIKSAGEEIGPVIRIPREDYLSPVIRRQVADKKLREALISAVENEDMFKLRRKKIRELAFSYNDGDCGKRAAGKIEKLLFKPKAGPSFLAESLDKYYNHFITGKIGISGGPGFWHSKKGREEAAKRYLKIKSLPFWQKISVVMDEFFGNENEIGKQKDDKI